MVASRTGVAERLDQKLRALICTIAARVGLPGSAVSGCVGALGFDVSHGVEDVRSGIPMSTATRFEIGCVSEPLIALTVLDLADEGALHLHTPIGEYLPDLLAANGPLASSITLTHLLSHTSGVSPLENEDSSMPVCVAWQDLVEAFGRARALFRPGPITSSNATDYAIVGRIIQRCTGRMPIRRLLSESLRDLRRGSSRKRSRCTHHRYDAANLRAAPVEQPQATELVRLGCRNLLLSAAQIAQVGRMLSQSSSLTQPVASISPAIPNLNGKPCERPIAMGLGCDVHADGSAGRVGTTLGQCVSLRFRIGAEESLGLGINTAIPAVRDFLVQRVRATIEHVTGARSFARSAHAPDSDLRDEEIIGTYSSSSHLTIQVLRSEKRLALIAGESPPFAEIVTDEHGRRHVATITAHAPIAFFRDPASGAPVLGLGLHALRRIA